MAISVGHTIKELHKMASDLGIYDIRGSGKDGKIKKEDLSKNPLFYRATTYRQI